MSVVIFDAAPGTEELSLMAGDSVVALDGGTVNLQPARLDVGKDDVFTIKNTGSVSLTVDGAHSSTGGDSGDITIDPATTLDPGESMTFTVSRATDVLGNKSYTVSIEHDGDASPFTFTANFKVVEFSSRIIRTPRYARGFRV